MKLCLILLGLIAFTATSLAQIPSYVPTEGLAAWYSFDQNTDDESDNSNSLSGIADFTAGHIYPGWAVTNFQVSDPLVCEAPSFIYGRDSSFTISCWIKSNDSLSSGMIAKHWNQVTSSDFTWGIGKSSTRIAFSCAGGYAGWTSCYYNENVPIDTWLHLIATYEAGLMKFYVNTDLVESNYCPDTSTTSQLRFRVGHDPWNNSVLTDADVDDMGIWNRILSADEREALFIGAVGIHDLTMENEILLYPNPSNDLVYLEIMNASIPAAGGEIYIYNPLGECVHRDIVKSRKMQIDIRSLANGIYILYINAGQANIARKLVIR